MKEQIIYDRPQEQILKGEQAYFQSEPWPRFIARLMDTYVFSLVVGVIFTIFNSFIFDLLNIQASYGLTSIVILWILAGVMFLIIEALLLSTVGTTPGKFLMGVRINKKKWSIYHFFRSDEADLVCMVSWIRAKYSAYYTLYPNIILSTPIKRRNHLLG